MGIKLKASKFIDGLTVDAEQPDDRDETQDVQIDVYVDPYEQPIAGFSVARAALPGVELGDEFELRPIKR
jgi:hypothetical protein